MKDGYKMTTIGELPNHWQVVELNYLLNLLTDFEANGSFADVKANVTIHGSENFAWYVRATDLENKTDLRNVKYVDEQSYNFLRKTTLHGNELLVAKRGEIGKVYYFDKPYGIRATLAPNLYLLKLNSKVCTKFLYYYFISPKGNKTLIRINASSTIGALYKDDVKKLSVPFPPLSEQQKIAEILSTVDEKIEVIAEQIEQTHELKKGLMQRLLTKGIGHTQFKDSPLGQVPECWEVVKLGDITERITKGTTPTTAGYQYQENGINFIKVESITGDGNFLPDMFAHIDEVAHAALQRSQLQLNDILFSIAGALGRTAIVTKDILPANTNQALAIIRLQDKELLNFIYHYLRCEFLTAFINKINVQTAQANLSLGNIQNFNIPIPPKAERDKITDVLDSMGSKLKVLNDKKEQYQELKKGLMQRLLTGKLRVNHLIEQPELA